MKVGEGPDIDVDASASILWPPNNKLQDVIVTAVVSDNSGGPVTISVAVTADEPITEGEDYQIVSIDQVTGRIDLKLRAARQGQGDGRTYTITVTATDAAGNTSIAEVTIVAPHDQGGGNGP